MRGGGELECMTVCICDSRCVSVTPGGLGGKGSLRVFGSMVKIRYQIMCPMGSRAGRIMVRAKLERAGTNRDCHMVKLAWILEFLRSKKQTTL